MDLAGLARKIIMLPRAELRAAMCCGFPVPACDWWNCLGELRQVLWSAGLCLLSADLDVPNFLFKGVPITIAPEPEPSS